MASSCHHQQQQQQGVQSSLLCFLQGLHNYKTTIELRNEITIEGTIKDVDDRMNTVISDVTYKLLDGTTTQFDELFIPGVQIRYVHIPDEVDVMKVITQKIQEGVMKEKNNVPYSRQKLSLKKMSRIEEEKRMVREFVIGKGRITEHKTVNN